MVERAFELSSQELLDANAELAAALEALGGPRSRPRRRAGPRTSSWPCWATSCRNPLAPIVTALDLARLKGVSTIDARDIERPVRQVHAARRRSARHRPRRARRAGAGEAPSRAGAGRSQRGRGDPARGDPAPARPGGRRSRGGLLVDGDEARLTQVVSNLLINSVRYTEPGGIIGVTGEHDGDDVVLRVRTTGRASAPSGCRRSSIRSAGRGRHGVPRGAGLGLGLTIVRNLVELHGGTVTAAQRRAGPRRDVRGARFRRWRCRSRAGAPGAALRADRGEPPQGPHRRRQPRGGESHGRRAEAGPATRWRWPTWPARRCSAAERFTPDVALLDLGLSDMSGHRAGRAPPAAPRGAEAHRHHGLRPALGSRGQPSAPASPPTW